MKIIFFEVCVYPFHVNKILALQWKQFQSYIELTRSQLPGYFLWAFLCIFASKMTGKKGFKLAMMRSDKVAISPVRKWWISVINEGSRVMWQKEITKLKKTPGLKESHLQCLHVNKEVPARHHYGKNPKTFLENQHGGLPLQSTCTLMHTIWGINVINYRCVCSCRTIILLGSQRYGGMAAWLECCNGGIQDIRKMKSVWTAGIHGALPGKGWWTNWVYE